jgi:hypothetical protein
VTITRVRQTQSAELTRGLAIAGTLRQLHILQAAEAASKSEDATELEKTSLLEIPRGKYKELDQLDDILENGGKLAEQQRKLLIRLPMSGLVLCFFGFGYVGYVAAMAVLGDGLNPGEFMLQYTLQIQILCVLLSGIFVLLLAALQPTFVRAIVYVNRGLVIYFRERSPDRAAHTRARSVRVSPRAHVSHCRRGAAYSQSAADSSSARS